MPLRDLLSYQFHTGNHVAPLKASLPFTNSEDGLSLFLSLKESPAHLALWKLTKGWVIREYAPTAVEFETAV
jgi:hypothetical protein